MKIVTLRLCENHWSSRQIPISYPKHTWTKWFMQNGHHRMRLGKTFLWSSTAKAKGHKRVMAICRVFPVTKDRLELGDVWLNPELRGKTNAQGVKHSLAFLRRVIARIWNLYKQVDTISLRVHKDNYAALRLYETLAFHRTPSVKHVIHNVHKDDSMITMTRRRGKFIRVFTTTPSDQS